MTFHWSPQSIETLKTLWAQGTACQVIAEALGTTVKVVHRRRHALGLPKRETWNAGHWTPELIDKLRHLHAEGQNDSKIGAALGLSPTSIGKKRKQLGLPAVPVKPFRQRMAEARQYTPVAKAWDALEGTQPKALVDLEPGDCRWPVGESPFRFCAAPKVGKTYCAHHEAISRSTVGLDDEAAA